VTAAFDRRWWREQDEPHNAVRSTVERIAADQRDREMQLLRWVSLFGDFPALGLTAGTYRVVRVRDAQRLSYNVVASVCETLQSEVIQSRPRPMFLTSGGDWDEQEKAKQLSKYTEGLFYACGVDTTAPRCALDALVTGTGACKVFAQDGKVQIERVFPWELLVDERDGYDGKPRSLYQRKWVDRDVLREMYPEHGEDIDGCGLGAQDYAASDALADQILVTEAWHLRSGPEATDGRHVIVCEAATLLDEEWEEDGFPFAFIRWQVPLMGFWGVGPTERLDGLQCEINRLARDMQIQQYYHANPKIAVPRGSRLVKAHWTNDPAGAFVEYDGAQPPTVLTFPAVSPDTYNALDRHYKRAYELIGVSQMSAQSVKPAGLDSGVAMRTYLDNQSKRFLLFGRAYEEWHVEVARLAVRAMRRLAEEDKAYDVVYRDSDHVERIAWEDVAIDEDSYILHVFPISALANSPAGRLQQLQELFQAGLIDRDMFLELSNLPDFESQRNLLTAPRELIEKRIFQMLRDGRYYPPEPFMNLGLARMVVGLAYQRAELQGVGEDRLELLRRFLADTDALQSPSPTAPAPQDGAPPADGSSPQGPPPEAPPGPPPGPQGPAPGPPPPDQMTQPPAAA
jgi:hypothetical protein